MKTNETILSQSVISNSDINLLKNRSNKQQKDVIDYNTFERMSLDSESGKKGLTWLRSLLTSKGEARKNVPLGYREIEIIKNATESDFNFCGFYDNGNKRFSVFLPIYELNGMEYVPYAHCEKIYIIG